MPLNDPTRPPRTAQMNCPACGHPINFHDMVVQDGCCRDAKQQPCRCIWTPNDIAYVLLFGGLTPAPDPAVFDRPAMRPLGAWE